MLYTSLGAWACNKCFNRTDTCQGYAKATLALQLDHECRTLYQQLRLKCLAFGSPCRTPKGSTHQPMAGGHLKYRHLNRKSSHRQALLRNLVTSLITHESIKTTWPKAKEAQRLAEKLITLGKKNTNASRQKAQSIFYVCWPLTFTIYRLSFFLPAWE